MSTIRTASFLAIKDLKRDKKIAVLVVFVIAFSYLNIAFFSAFVTGLGNTFQNNVIDTATSHVYITPSEVTNAKYVNNVDSLRKKIELNKDVTASAPRLAVPVSVSFRSKTISVSAYGISPSDEERVSTVSDFVVNGEFLSDTSDNEILLGRIISGEKIEDAIGQERFGTLAEGLGADVGDIVSVKFANGVEKNYRVRGIVASEGFNFVSQSAFMTFKEAESILDLDNKASSILVRLDDKNKADAVKRFIMEQGVSGVEIRTWFEASSFVGAITSTFNVVTIATTIVGIVVVVVTIGIVVFINTARKKRIIGVLKAIGMNSNDILLVFLLQSFILGTAGMVLGVGLYSLASYLTYITPISLPIGDLILYLPNDSIITYAAVITVSSLVAGYIPARMASRQKILETIKTVE